MTTLLANIYGLRPIDETDPRWSRVDFYLETSGSAAAQVNSAVVEPPLDKIWFVTGVYGLAQGAAGVVPVSIRFSAVNVRNAAIIYTMAGVRFNPAIPAAASGIFSQKVDALLIGGETGIRAVFGFDAGDVGNVQHWSFNGYEMPKGNIQI